MSAMLLIMDMTTAVPSSTSTSVGAAAASDKITDDSSVLLSVRVNENYNKKELTVVIFVVARLLKMH